MRNEDSRVGETVSRRVPVGGGGAITRLGLGAASLAGLYTAVTEEEAAATVEAAWDVGIRYFDTAPHYGLGLSEQRLGAALRGRPRAEFTVSTKLGRLLEPLPGPEYGNDLAHGFAVPATHRRVWDASPSSSPASTTCCARRPAGSRSHCSNGSATAWTSHPPPLRTLRHQRLALERVEGVHGPGSLHIAIVEPDRQGADTPA